MLIGASMAADDLPGYAKFLAGNHIMRVFPVTKQVAVGRSSKVLPPWTDPRLLYCQANNTIPFVSTKVDGDPDGLAYVRAQLLAMPAWVTILYITDRHEPEGDVTAPQFKANFAAFLAMVDSLPAALRSRIRCGPVLTRTWTEKRSGGNGDYSIYDPGTGDFFGVDMYVGSGSAKAVVTPETVPSPAEFLKTVKAYRKSPTDTRPRIFPELGLIGMPGDVDGRARAAWLRGVYAETSTWSPATTGWPFLGFIWWHAPGKATGTVYQIGNRRDFPLHLRTEPGDATGAGAAAKPLPGQPPAPVAAYNDIFAAQTGPKPVPSVAVDLRKFGDMVWMYASVALPAAGSRLLFTIPGPLRPAVDFVCPAAGPAGVVQVAVSADTGEVTLTGPVTGPAGTRIVVYPVVYPVRTAPIGG